MAGDRVDVAIIGAGAMGAGIAQVAAAAGHRVKLFDTRERVAQAAVESIGAALEKLVAKQRISAEQARQTRANLHAIQSLDEIRGCGLVIEAIVEELEAKRRLFRDVERIVEPGTLLATNTSSISITAIASALKQPELLAGMHFFNPAPVMPLVEIISGAATSREAADELYETAKRWGKTPVRARSTPGFIVNRSARPFYAEALRVLNEQAADCATIDAVMRESGGFRMGPFELMDLIGNDVNYAVTRSVWEAFYCDSRFMPSLLQKEMVDAGHLGRKTGRGYYAYGENEGPAQAQSFRVCPAPNSMKLYGDSPLANELAKRLSATVLSAHPDGRIAEAEDCVLFLTDGRTATARAAEMQTRNIVLIDLALNYGNAARLAIAAADQTGDSALESAAGLLQAAGYAVSAIDDVAGMIVMRTVCMLANEAADAVNQGVCSAADADLAMQKGVNYPRGPLDWARSLGLSNVVQALDNLATAYGEDRYRVSPLLRRKAIAGGKIADESPDALGSPTEREN